jgi:O-antigen/teichoic acid export membrane protein
LKSGAGISTLIKPFIKNDRHLLKNVSLKNIVSSAERYIRFPLYTAPTKLLLSLSTHLPFLFISGLYSTSIVGLYSLANMITFLPMTLIGQSVGDVFFGEAASIGKNNPKRIKELYGKLLKKLLLTIATPMIILILFGPLLFSFVFGQNWYEAGVYSRILTIYVFSYFIFHPASGIFYIFEKQNFSLFLNIINISVVLIVFGAAKIYLLSSHMAVFCFSIGKMAVEIVRYLLIQKILNESIKNEDVINV